MLLALLARARRRSTCSRGSRGSTTSTGTSRKWCEHPGADLPVPLRGRAREFEEDPDTGEHDADPPVLRTAAGVAVIARPDVLLLPGRGAGDEAGPRDREPGRLLGVAAWRSRTCGVLAPHAATGGPGSSWCRSSWSSLPWLARQPAHVLLLRAAAHAVHGARRHVPAPRGSPTRGSWCARRDGERRRSTPRPARRRSRPPTSTGRSSGSTSIAAVGDVRVVLAGPDRGPASATSDGARSCGSPGGSDRRLRAPMPPTRAHRDRRRPTASGSPPRSTCPRATGPWPALLEALPYRKDDITASTGPSTSGSPRRATRVPAGRARDRVERGDRHRRVHRDRADRPARA